MSIPSLLQEIAFLSMFVVDVAVLCFAVFAYRRTKLPALGLLALGAFVAITTGTAFHIRTYVLALDSDDITFHFIYRLGYICAVFLSGTGTILLIRHVLACHANEHNLSR